MRAVIASSFCLLAAAACNEPSVIPLVDPVDVVTAPEPPDFGPWLSMDVDPAQNRLVVTYWDREAEAVGFALGTPQADGTVLWGHEQVDGYRAAEGELLANVGKFASMRVAPDGTVWVAYYDISKKRLKWARRLGGGPTTGDKDASWVTGVIDEEGNVGTWASLDIGSDGNPVVAYHDEDRGVLKVAHVGTSDLEGAVEWVVTDALVGQDFSSTDEEGLTTTRPADVGEFARLTIQGNTEYIAYYDRAQKKLGFLEGERGGTYTPQIFPESTSCSADGQWPSMVIAGGTTPVVAYHDVQNQNLCMTTRGAGGFEPPAVVDAAPYVGADTEIVERNGTIGIVYFDGQNSDMKYASKQGEAWVSETLGGDTAPVGFHNEIVRLGQDWWAASYNFNTRKIFVSKLKAAGGAPAAPDDTATP